MQEEMRKAKHMDDFFGKHGILRNTNELEDTAVLMGEVVRQVDYASLVLPSSGSYITLEVLVPDLNEKRMIAAPVLPEVFYIMALSQRLNIMYTFGHRDHPIFRPGYYPSLALYP